MNYDSKQLVKYIVWKATQNGKALSWTRLIKFLYLADLYHAQIRNGKIITNWPWSFVHFGPYCSEAYETVQAAEAEGLIEKRTYESKYEDRDEFDLFFCNDPEEPLIGKKLHIHIISYLDRAIKRWGDDTASLLDYVYFETDPMRHALPKQKLDFLTAKKPDIPPRIEMKKIPVESLNSGQGLIEKLKEKHRAAVKENIDREKQRLECGLYDEHYEQVLQHLDEEDLATGLSGIVKFNF
jgi:hypothetical protein